MTERLEDLARRFITFMNEGEYAESGLAPWQIDREQLEMGIEVELEHTSDEEIARKIALDHLAEDPRYYTKLLDAGL